MCNGPLTSDTSAIFPFSFQRVVIMRYMWISYNDDIFIIQLNSNSVFGIKIEQRVYHDIYFDKISKNATSKELKNN